MAWEKVESNVITLDNDKPEVIGVLKKIDENGLFGEQYVLDIDGKEFILGHQTVLETKIDHSMLNKRIKVVYIGEKISKKRNQKYKDFDVFVDKTYTVSKGDLL